MDILYLLAAAVVTFLIRVAPVLLWGRPDLSTGDVMNHLNLIDGFRSNRHRVPDFRAKFLLTDPENYPVLYHWALSYLPRQTVDRLEPFLGAIVETVHAICIFGLTYAFALNWGSNSPAAIAFFAAVLFATTALLLGVENYGRVFRMSPRPLGAFFNAVAYMSIVLFQTQGSYGWLLIGSVAAALTGLTSTFGVQALVFITAFMSLFALDARPLLILPTGFCLGVLLSRGHLLAILGGNLNHSHFYCTYLSDRICSTRYTFRQLLYWPLTLVRSPMDAIRLLITHYVFISFTLFPWTILLLVSYGFKPGWIDGSDGLLERYMLNWYLAGVTTMVLTATPWLKFLGEASRYIIYSATPVCILAAWRTVEINDPRLWYIATGLGVIALMGVVCSWATARYARRDDPDRATLYEWIKEQPASTLLTIDLRLSFLLCFRTPHATVNWHINAPRGENLQKYKELIAQWYPFPDTDLSQLVRQYDVTLVVVDDKAVAAFQEMDAAYRYDLGPYDEVFQCGRFRVLRPHPIPNEVECAAA